MDYDLLIIRYGEIALKATETRRRFENILINNIKNSLNSENITYYLKKERGRIYIYTKMIDESIEILKKIFGIVSISPAIKTDYRIESIYKIALNYSKENITKNNSFALRVTRTGIHNFTSQEIAVKVGDHIVQSLESSVNLNNPDFELFIEIRGKNVYLFTEKVMGTGGLPLGSQGTVLSIIENNRSILASWYLMKRGCNIIYVITNITNKKALSNFVDNWYGTSIKTDVDESKPNFFNELNEIVKKNECSGIVVGYSIFLDDDFDMIYKLKNNLGLPILCPLITMDKKEINSKLEKKVLF